MLFSVTAASSELNKVGNTFLQVTVVHTFLQVMPWLHVK